MKKLPELNVGHEGLYRMLVDQVRSKLLLAGIELGIFNFLANSISADDVAAALGSHPVNTGLFLDGLASIDLVHKKNGLYQNTPAAQTFLVEGNDTYLGEEFARTVQMWNQAINDLPKLVREGPSPAPGTDMGSEELWAQFAVSMANDERAGTAQQMANVIAGLPEFPSFRKMLDLGGGPGLMGVAMVTAHPTMKGIVFDRPAVVKVTRQFIDEYELAGRMSVMAGDYTKDYIGEEYDLVWACATLNAARNDLDPLIKKIYDALNPGGVFASATGGLTHERTKPDVRVLEGMATSMKNAPHGYDQGCIAEAVLRAGFKSIRSFTLTTNWGPMDLDIGRKQG